MHERTILTSLALLCAACAEQPRTAASEGYVDVIGGRIWYQTMGNASGIPLLVIHGGPGDQSCGYLTTLAQLATTRPVIVYDQLGSGRSDRPTDTTLFKLPRFVDEITKLREALGLAELHIMGHSWGGALAVEYMLTASPTGVKSLTLAGPLVSTEAWISDANLLRRTMPEPLQATLATGDSTGVYDTPEYLAATDSFYTRFFVRSGWPRPAPTTCDGRGEFNTQIYQHMWGPTEFTATGTLRDFDRTTRLSELDLPVLFIAGRYDEARPETMAAFQQRVANARLEIIEDAGHMSMEDQPERFNAAVQAFLTSVESNR